MNEYVREGYDIIAEAYAAQRDDFKSLPYLERLASLLSPRVRVLDVGCGAGLPVSRYFLDKGCRVTGIDISKRMIALARHNNPDGAFEVRDMTALRPSEFAVDVIVSFYALFHVAREEHAALLGRFRSFLQPGGLLLLTMGGSEWEGSEDFFGVEMFWSHYGPEKNRQLVETAGFEVLLDELDLSGGERHQVLLARAI